MHTDPLAQQNHFDCAKLVHPDSASFVRLIRLAYGGYPFATKVDKVEGVVMHSSQLQNTFRDVITLFFNGAERASWC